MAGRGRRGGQDPCPLHGRRFQTVVKRHLYWAVRCYVADFERGWPHRSAQYQKAMRVSLDPTVASTRSENEVFNRRPQ